MLDNIDPTVVIDLATAWGPRIIGAIAIFAIGWIVSKWAHSRTVGIVNKKELDQALGRFLASLVQWTVMLAAVIAAVDTVGFEVTSLVAVFASAGLAVGLALQGNLAHFASGVMILIFRPFTIGDVVTVAGSTGAVVEVGLFATTLHTPDGLQIIVPNGAITGGTIVNVTTRGTRRADVAVGVDYGTDPLVVIDLLTKAAQACPSVLDEPGVAVAFVGLGDSSIDFSVMGWSKSADYLAALHEIRSACYNTLNEANIGIPYPQVVHHQAEAAGAARRQVGLRVMAGLLMHTAPVL